MSTILTMYKKVVVSPVKCNGNTNPAGQVLGMAGTDFRPVGRARPAFRLGR